MRAKRILVVDDAADVRQMLRVVLSQNGYEVTVASSGPEGLVCAFDEDPDLIKITQYFFDQNKPIASVCHGVEIPARADRVRGRKMATVPKCQFDLEICGGTFVNEPCVIDGNLVSGRTFHDNGHYVGPWIKMLEEAATTKKTSAA